MKATGDPKTATLLYEDDFDSLDWSKYLSRWWYTSSDVAGCNLPSNGELQLYVNHDGPLTETPWTVADSVLSLTATPDTTYGYLSGMLNTYGFYARTYGHFEARMKMPPGAGMWPAFWLLPQDGSWPPEIDVLEWLGRDPLTEYIGTHSGAWGGNAGQGGPYPIPDGSAAFHDYACDWQADFCTFYFDGQEVAQFDTPPDMHKPMYFVLNLAIGGGWAGPPDDSTPWPASLEIDWVRVYDSSPYASNVTPPEPGPPPGAWTGVNHNIPSPWASWDLREVMLEGDTVTLGFGYEELTWLRDETDVYLWARTGTTVTLAAIIPGSIVTVATIPPVEGRKGRGPDPGKGKELREKVMCAVEGPHPGQGGSSRD